jgi:hypothetical protein
VLTNLVQFARCLSLVALGGTIGVVLGVLSAWILTSVVLAVDGYSERYAQVALVILAIYLGLLGNVIGGIIGAILWGWRSKFLTPKRWAVGVLALVVWLAAVISLFRILSV